MSSGYTIEQIIKEKTNNFKDKNPKKIKAIKDFNAGKITLEEAKKILAKKHK